MPVEFTDGERIRLKAVNGFSWARPDLGTTERVSRQVLSGLRGVRCRLAASNVRGGRRSYAGTLTHNRSVGMYGSKLQCSLERNMLLGLAAALAPSVQASLTIWFSHPKPTPDSLSWALRAAPRSVNRRVRSAGNCNPARHQAILVVHALSRELVPMVPAVAKQSPVKTEFGLHLDSSEEL
jgi:hypothetical protein